MTQWEVFTWHPFCGHRCSPFRLLPSLWVSSSPPQLLRKPVVLCCPSATPPPSEGRVRSGAVEGVLRVCSRGVSALPFPPFGGGGEGGHRGGLGFCRCDQFNCFLPPVSRGSLVGSSHSQESLVLADPDWLDGWEGLPGPGGVFQPQLSRVLDGWESLPCPTPAHSLPIYLPRGVEILVKSVTVPSLGLGDRALAPRTVHGHVDDNAPAVTRHSSPLPVCGLVDPG